MTEQKQNNTNEAHAKVVPPSILKGFLGKFSEGFRKSSGELGDVLLDKMNNPTPRSELFPYRFFDEEKSLYFLDENIAGFTFECNTVVGVSDDLYKQISMLFDDQLPSGGVLEVLLVASDDLSPAIDKWEKPRVRKDEIYKKLTNHRSKFFNDYNKREDVNFQNRNYRLFFSYSNNIGKNIDNISKFKNRLRSILDSIDLQPRSLRPTEFLSLVKEITNYPDFTNPNYSENVPLSDQICDVGNAMLVSEEGVLLDGGKYTSRVYESTTYPSDFSIGQLPVLLGDIDTDAMQVASRFAIIYTISNEITNPQQEGLKKKGEMVIKQASGMLEKFNRTLKEEGQEWNQIIEKNLKNKERFLRSSFLVMITAPTRRIEYVEQSLMSLWRKNDFTIKPLKYFHLPGLLCFCPYLNKTGLGKLAKRFNIKRTVLSSEPKALLPIHAEWKGSQNGGVILTGRRGQLFTWNNFEGGSNYNVCVIGESGSGKSVFLQEFVMTQLAQGARVFVVDIGRSFEKTCKIMGGDFLSFGSASKTSLNPFSNIPDNGNYDPKGNEDEENINIVQDSLNYLKRIVAKMAAPIAGTTDIQNVLIAQALQEVWDKHKSSANIDKLVEVLSSKGTREKDIALLLHEFTSKGNYGKFFNGKDNIKFDKQLTVLEFEELREQPELGGVIMQMLAIQIVQQVYLGDRKQKFIILFDEAWYALENFPLFLASMARTVRKYNGALVLGTQSLKNFYGGSSAAEMYTAKMGVIENSAWRVLLRQSGDSSESLEKMRLSESLIDTIKGLTTSAGNYSEMLIYQSDKNYFVSRLMLDKFAQTLYSSSPDVFARVKHYLGQGMDTAKAVETVMLEDSDETKF